MAKEFAKPFYNSKRWKQCRAAYIAKRIGIDGGMCERCNKEMGYIVHHIKYITPSDINNPDVTLNWNNLEYVCKACHDREHFGNDERYVFDEQGNAVPIPPPMKQGVG